MNLAALLEEMGERAEARRLYEEVVAGETAQLGPAHTSTLRTKYNLATLLACCRRWGNLKKPCCCSRRTGSDRRRAPTKYPQPPNAASLLPQNSLKVVRTPQIWLYGCTYNTRVQ